MKLRLYEFKGDDRNNLLSFSQMQDASSILQLSTIETTQNMLDNVQVILSEILHSNVQHLHNIKHYPRYVDVVAATLKQKLNLIDRMVSQQESMRQKQDDTQSQIHKLHPLLKLVIQRTKELQAEIEQDISKKYKNRTVYLTGGVNML